MPDALTPLQSYYIGAIELGLVIAGFTAAVACFALGFVIVRGFSSHG